MDDEPNGGQADGISDQGRDFRPHGEVFETASNRRRWTGARANHPRMSGKLDASPQAVLALEMIVALILEH